MADLGTASSLEKLEVPLVSKGRKKCFPPESLKELDKTELAGEAFSCYKGGRTSHMHLTGLLQDTERCFTAVLQYTVPLASPVAPEHILSCPGNTGR